MAALVAFAANSVLCRLALATGAIDPAGFTLVRAFSAAAMLALVLRLRRWPKGAGWGSWSSGSALAVYLVSFSFAYVTLEAGVGALILFAAVQATMIGAAVRGGERPGVLGWGGLIVAAFGLVGLLAPGAAAPTLVGTALMAGAGVAWGVYSLRGRSEPDALAASAGNFVRSLPLVVVLAAWALPGVFFTAEGVLWAAVSGALASGLGYVAWYAAVSRLATTTAAVAQLSVPVLAAVAGVVLLGESWTPGQLAAGAATLAGVTLAVATRTSR